MKVRPVGNDGDMIPIQYDSQMVGGGQAVAQIVKDRLSFYHGEWWEDDDMGVKIPDFLMDTVRKSDVDIFTKYITSYIASTEGVIGITNASVEFNKRVLRYRCIIHTEEGSEEMEVDLSGLL